MRVWNRQRYRTACENGEQVGLRGANVGRRVDQSDEEGVVCRVASNTELFWIKQIGAVDDGLVLYRMPPAEEVSTACRQSGAANFELRGVRTIPWTTAAIEHMKICARRATWRERRRKDEEQERKASKWKSESRIGPHETETEPLPASTESLSGSICGSTYGKDCQPMPLTQIDGKRERMRTFSCLSAALSSSDSRSSRSKFSRSCATRAALYSSSRLSSIPVRSTNSSTSAKSSSSDLFLQSESWISVALEAPCRYSTHINGLESSWEVAF